MALRYRIQVVDPGRVLKAIVCKPIESKEDAMRVFLFSRQMFDKMVQDEFASPENSLDEEGRTHLYIRREAQRDNSNDSPAGREPRTVLQERSAGSGEQQESLHTDHASMEPGAETKALVATAPRVRHG
jgi:hypothetical protein